MYVTYPYLDPMGYLLMSQEEVAADGCQEDAAALRVSPTVGGVVP